MSEKQLRNSKGQFKKGNQGFWLGKKRSDLTSTNTSKTMFKKGFIPWNAGTATKKNCLNCKERFKVSPSRLSRSKYCSIRCKIQASPRSTIKVFCKCGNIKLKHSKNCRSCANLGKLSPFYRHGRCKENMTERQIAYISREYKQWRMQVFKRDKYKCVWCGSTKNLQADHIRAWSLYPELRYVVDNGRALCKSCHKNTDTYGARSRFKGGGAREFQSL